MRPVTGFHNSVIDSFEANASRDAREVARKLLAARWGLASQAGDIKPARRDTERLTLILIVAAFPTQHLLRAFGLRRSLGARNISFVGSDSAPVSLGDLNLGTLYVMTLGDPARVVRKLG